MKYDVTTREIFLYDSIGKTADGYFGADILAEALSKMGSGTIWLRINSPGGSLFEVWAMYELIQRHKSRFNSRILTCNDGLAASAASIILLAGDHRRGSKESVTMIHLPWVLAAGNEHELRETADNLTVAGERLARYYVERLGCSREQVDTWLKSDTYFDSDQALKHGFIHQIGSGVGQAVAATSKTPSLDQAKAKLAKRQAKLRVDNARCQMTEYYDAKANNQQASRTMDKATESSNFPNRVAASLQILRRKIARHASR